MRTNCSSALLALVLLAAGCGDSEPPAGASPLCGDEASPPVNLDASGERELPAWYDDAKLGIMVHWGVWTVPAWAETTLDPERVADPNDPDYLLAPGGLERFLRHNPYTEWYRNSLAIEGTETQAFHRSTFGAGFPYESFQPLFEERSAPWRPADWATLFREAGARYAVLVTKHHDGYALWPTAAAHPARPGWHSTRDVVGELADAVRESCLRFGVYYSGGIDWSFKPPPIETALDFLLAVPPGEDYARYVDAQWRELIERYRPSILWNDISSPPLTDERALFTDYYAAVPDGVVNDRWSGDPNTPPADFASVEYDVRDEIATEKWEAVRGIGRAFGYNANQRDEDYGSPEKYLHLLVDVVSKNGNLLLNVGPRVDGSIPEPQVAILRAIGAWLATNGEAIHGTRPWTRFGGVTADGIAVRFTRRPNAATIYAVLLGTPAGSSITLTDFPETPASVRRLGASGSVAWTRDGGGIRIELGAPLGSDLAHAFAIELAPPAS